ncbi:glutathione-dependent formaldehyde dehydrogenase [Halalkalibacter hemicellulosilyticusJCM 9152]|uniref:Glutathione-dependent formaldehyde dehydrogenase n=1 Tax=Halalkalibacter hemicellulosilyticusJCM 9152 TaxID=1236971 RepID=W4QGU6_9BACI|nr:glutathione-dependent formaldehyde dehydrogenase [Halalkalibacter hemicellulosilyticusJCM 9152]
MKAVTYQGKYEVTVKKVKDPTIKKNDDIIIKVTSTAICGSDLHLYQGNFPLPIGYTIGHEPMGIVEEVGSNVTSVKKGDRVVIPFTVACGSCYFCDRDLESQCDHANLIMIRAGILGILKNSAIIQVVKRSICMFRLGIIRRFLFLRIVN